MSELTQEIQSLDQSSDIFLYELSQFNPENPAEIFRFSNQNGVSWGGPTVAIPCSHDQIEYTSQGTQPRLSFTVADVNGVISALVDSVDGLEGAVLKVRRTKRRFLDDGSTPDTSAILQQSDMVIARVSSFAPRVQIVFELVNKMDYGQAKLPSRLCLRSCSWTYRGSECGYTGAAMFTIAGTPTLDPRADSCGKRLSDCKLRFPNAVLPTSAFPTLTRR